MRLLSCIPIACTATAANTAAVGDFSPRKSGAEEMGPRRAIESDIRRLPSAEKEERVRRRSVESAS